MAEKKRPPQLWKPGQSGNPKGKPKGARHHLGEAFLRDLRADWEEHGKDALRRAREKKPEVYVTMVAKLLPKQIQADLNVSDLETVLRGLARRDAEYDPALESEAPAIRH